MKIVVTAASALSLSIVNILASPQDDAFQKLAHDYVEQYLQANPEQATELGDHRFDGELTDDSAEARAKDLATQKEFRDKLNAIDGSQLNSVNAVDFRILKENIDYEIFRAEELKEPEWNPLVYMQSLANSLYLLVARDFAPADKLFRSGALTRGPINFTIRASAGSFRYYCELHGTPDGQGMAGTVKVRPIAETDSLVGEIAVVWADSNTNTGSRFDVRYRVDNRRWKTWRNDTSSFHGAFGHKDSPVNYRPSRHNYKIKVRSERRRVKKHSDWSPVLRLG
jgi:hypothetical protein